MGRAFRPSGERSRCLIPGRGHAGAAPFLSVQGVLSGFHVLALVLALAASAASAPAQDDAPRLLTALTAEVGPEGVALAWTVDETRAHRIAGFSCVYRTPGHLKLDVGGAVPCDPLLSPAEARGRTVSELPEYGDYDFELVADEAPGGPKIPWPLRALRLRVAVTEDLAGPTGAGRAVSGAGPLVESCGLDEGKAETAGARPWRLDDIVSAAHLTHYPGRGWSAGGDAAAPPDWPEPPSLAELVEEAGLDAAPVREVLAGAGADAGPAAAVIADARFDPVLARAAAGTKALLRPGRDGALELRLHSSYPFGADYVFEARHAVPGWGDAGHPVARADLRHRVSCPPPDWPSATHDVALALSDAAGDGRRLAHSGYGWWAVAPVGMAPARIVATKAGLSYGDRASRPPEAPGSWRGRLDGHLFWDRRRFALAGEVVLTLARTGATVRLAGRIDNVVLTPLDHENLRPDAGPALPWRSLILDPASVLEGAWTGDARAGARSPREVPEGMPAADTFRGDWRAMAYGPDAGEVAGRLRLWTPLAAGANPAADWPGQAVLVAGFGAARVP